MTDTTTLGGRPITGDITVPYHRRRIEPAPIIDLVDAIDDLLVLPNVEGVRWVAHTPSWNDGDPCVFGAYGASVKLAGISQDLLEDTETADGFIEADWELSYFLKDNPSIADVVTPAVLAAGKKFAAAIESGAHDLDLQKYFGDPHEVIATTEGFQVEYYEGGY